MYYSLEVTCTTLLLIVSVVTSQLMPVLILNRQGVSALTSDLICLMPSLVYLTLCFLSFNTLEAAVADTALIHTDTSDIACVAVYSQFSHPGDKVMPPLL